MLKNLVLVPGGVGVVVEDRTAEADRAPGRHPCVPRLGGKI